MKILIITQKVDAADRTLGFFVRWIEEFAKHCERVTAICLELGPYRLPPNVSVHSLGKERLKIENWKLDISRRILYSCRFLRLIWSMRREYDSVFVHMNPEYAILGGLLWRVFGKKIVLWYVHKKVNWRVRLAEKLVDKIFTASRESCRLASKKVEVVGHGIPTEVFAPHRARPPKLNLVTVGRVSPIKDLHTIIIAFLALKRTFPEAELSIIGDPITERDQRYAAQLQEEFGAKVHFAGGAPYGSVCAKPYTVFVHASR
ncbi:MAG: hypothetical protein Greene041679_497, partial [Parcubacteria group bacterium Greene0416_79]